jgi:hypothetical protein
MKITTTRKEASFYIARVGSKAGQPMWNNYTSNNAFSVDSDNADHDFQKVLHLYRSGIINLYIIGTCQPSLRKRDIVNLIKSHHVSNAVLVKMSAIDKVIQVTEAKLNKLKQLQSAIARLK